MEEAFKREKEEADRLLREQKVEYETKIDELRKQVMETSMMSSSGIVDPSPIQQQTVSEDLETENDTISGKRCSNLSISINLSSIRMLLVAKRLSTRSMGMEKMA